MLENWTNPSKVSSAFYSKMIFKVFLTNISDTIEAIISVDYARGKGRYFSFRVGRRYFFSSVAMKRAVT